MRKYEITRVIQTRIMDVDDYDAYMDASESHGSRIIEAPNLFRAIVAMRKREVSDYDDAIEFGGSFYYPDWLEVWEVGDDGYTSARRYVLPMYDMI